MKIWLVRVRAMGGGSGLCGTSAQPFFEDRLILLFDLGEHHAHAVFAHIHDVTERRENRAAVEYAEPYPGACGERVLRAYLAAKHAEVVSLFAGLGFRFHFDQVDASRKRIAPGARTLDQELPSNTT